ncbi:nineteen complex-related protein 2-domain-containing protein [Rhexocercosporidium sp. MPI-PUGE-AT-0058]|nr:nineteen complex-related protein 2-domain-containing protein [Rhexocercosporidium sp. MPI-PUGE-AT-0058]
MKSAFGSKRKARKIQVDEDDEDGVKNDQVAEPVNTPNEKNLASTGGSTSSIPGRKTFKKSSLRQSIAFDDQSQDGEDGKGPQTTNKPTIGRSSSLMKKKKPPSSRLSFGPGEIISGDAAEALEDDEAFTPKRPVLGRRVMEGNALKRNLPHQGLPMRSNDDDEERPTYSKDYLNELKSSTPTTPKDLTGLHATAEDEQGLDATELEGAMVIDLSGDSSLQSNLAFIPSEAEIREKKERRARLANEKDFISFNDNDSRDRQQISLLPQKKKQESRLVREDEDLGEGFDEFVDDGRISLGKKQEREAKRRQRKEMADMIHQAEGSSDEDSDDSEAERRAAYETAQTRAGMDGLHKHDDSVELNAPQMPSKITPLPALSECLERLQSTLISMELELAKRHKQMEASRQEKNEIAAREIEVQELLAQAGARYAALKADTNGAVADPQPFSGPNNGFAVPMMADRGLESFGNTPTVRPAVEDTG